MYNKLDPLNFIKSQVDITVLHHCTNEILTPNPVQERFYDFLTGSWTFAVKKMTSTDCEVLTAFEMLNGTVLTVPTPFFDFNPTTNSFIIVDTVDPTIIAIHDIKMT